MRRVSILLALLALSLCATHLTHAQTPQIQSGLIDGQLIDSKTELPTEYANVLLFSYADSSRIAGTTSNRHGSFSFTNLEAGSYYIQIHFLGYLVKNFNEINLTYQDPVTHLGTIILTGNAIMLDGATVSAQKPIVTYQIDKKVINVDKLVTATSGTAVDVLKNVPSISVNIDGDVQLRGSSSFSVLIDGRPSMLDANDALQQIPVGTIKDIEIITNPSAKYQPDGVAGIINIIMKSGSDIGYNGVANVDAGNHDRYGSDLLLNFRNDGYKMFFGADFNKRNYPGTGEEESRTITDGQTTIVSTQSNDSRKGDSFGIRAGAEHNVTPFDVTSYGFRYGDRDWHRGSNRTHLQTDPLGSSSYTSVNNSGRGGTHYSANLDHKHKFADEDDKLSAQVIFSSRDGDEESISELFDEFGAISSGKRSTEKGPTDRLEISLDYENSFANESRIEAGFNSRIERAEDFTESFTFDTTQHQYAFQPEFSYSTTYKHDINAVYLIYKGEYDRMGYQAGLRGEHTFRSTELTGQTASYGINRLDYFPTAHVSYQLGGSKQLMVSYARRIERPRSWYLEPFETWSDAFNVRAGNPDLKPEYIDSYELGYQGNLYKYVFSTELYYRVTNNLIERIQTVYSPGVSLHVPENVGRDYAFGTEFRLNMRLFKWWNANLMSNIFSYKVEGNISGESYSNSNNNWSMTLNNTFNLTSSARLQLNANYESPEIEPQEREEESWSVDLGLRQEFLEKTLSLSFQVNDIFDSRKRESTSTGTDFVTHSLRRRTAPNYVLNITYNINNYKSEKRRRNGGGMDDEEF